MPIRNPLPRRPPPRGLGAAVAPPSLDATATKGAVASAANAVAPAANPAAPNRVAWFFIPNGVNIPNWTPTKTGALTELPPTLAPLKAVQNYLTVFSGLTLDNGRPKGDGPGDHARSAASFLTAAHPFKTSGSN